MSEYITLQQVAKEHSVDFIALTRFALTNQRYYGIVEEFGQVKVGRINVVRLVNRFVSLNGQMQSVELEAAS